MHDLTNANSLGVILRADIRFMNRADMLAVEEIERLVWGNQAWSIDDLIAVTRQKNCLGRVAQIGERIVGYEIHDLHKDKVLLRNIAVHPDFRRRRIGHQLVEYLIGRLSTKTRNRLVTLVDEAHLPTQQFFRACGLRAVEILHGHRTDGRDVYRFEITTGTPS